MSFTTKISILLLTLKIVSTTFLQAESNYLKPLLERNNIVNKGVWVRNSEDKVVEHSKTGDFLFGPNSLDADNVIQNRNFFDGLGDNAMQDSPGIFGYVERSKRSTNVEKNTLLRKNIKECKGDSKCILETINEKSNVKSQLISKLKPTSVFNDYPYEVAILLGDNKLDSLSAKNIRNIKESGNYEAVMPLYKNIETTKANIEPLISAGTKSGEEQKKDNNNSVITPKRNLKNEYESKVIKKIEITEDLEIENGTYKVDRDIFDRDERVWPQYTPETTYNVQANHPKKKLINERGLIKVLSMLTKTFKKIMKQHSDIKKIHSKLHNVNEEVNTNIIEINKKYRDIENKYTAILAVNDKMKAFESAMNMKEEYYRAKDREMADNLAEFENQQKKFLIQQKQFYNIQKLMLAQNEKINIKQNLIAKTQSEISHRQNNFARILKKAKQIYIDSKYVPNKIPSTTLKNVNQTEDTHKITHTTTYAPYTTESIKINLFSIPALNKLVNQDLQILKDKDEKPVDDLVYKYYFNNTFIDNLMKSKVLSSFVTTAENTEIARNAKNKRDHDELKATILLPVNSFNKTDGEVKLKRERRWIRHHHQSKSKLKKPPRHLVPSKYNDGKPLNPKTEVVLKVKDENSMTKMFAKDQTNPYLIMAKSFCNEIGQNVNDQMLNWCVEKSLRRLQFIDSRMSYISAPTQAPSTLNSEGQETKPNDDNNQPSSPSVSLVNPVTAPTAPLTSVPAVPALSTRADLIYFPDNDELESNLKNFDIKQDTEGNVYYDGSLHASDLGLGEDSEGFSDIMPGLDSNSKVEVDPLAFDLQARRRETVRRINANLIKKLYG